MLTFIVEASLHLQSLETLEVKTLVKLKPSETGKSARVAERDDALFKY